MKKILLILLLMSFTAVVQAQNFPEDDIESELEASEGGGEDSAFSEEEEEEGFEDFDESEEEEAFEEFEEENGDKKSNEKLAEEEEIEPKEELAAEEDVGDDVEIKEDDVAKDLQEEPIQEQVIIEEPTTVEEVVEGAPQETVIEEVTVSDDPDYNFENNIYEIYKIYQSEELTNEKWKEVFGETTLEKYKIQAGDNLWKISKTFFGDGHYWPKVWSLNKDIRNPHVIEKDHQIKFILGSESSEPSFSISEKGSDDDIEQEQQNYYEEDDVDIPPPSVLSRPVVRNIPPSFPSWQYDLFEKASDKDLGLTATNKVDIHSKGKTILTSYVDHKSPNTVGQIIGSESSTLIASLYQYVHVILNPGVGKVGRVLTVVDETGTIGEEDDKVKVAHKILIVGQIKLVENVGKKQGKDIYRAFIVSSMQNIRIGAMVSTAPVIYKKANLKGPEGSVRTKVIGGENGESVTLFSFGSKIYLDQGSADGIRDGEIFTIYTNPEARKRVGRNSIGKARMIDVREHFSTAIVVNATQEVFLGDWLEGSQSEENELADTSDEDVEANIEESTNLEELEGLDDDNDLEEDQSIAEDESEEEENEISVSEEVNEAANSSEEKEAEISENSTSDDEEFEFDESEGDEEFDESEDDDEFDE